MWPFNNAKRENELMNDLQEEQIKNYSLSRSLKKHEARCKFLQATIDRQADLIGRYQAAKPSRDSDGKFAKSNKVRETTQALAASMGLPDPFIKVT
jgi:hypothetical protein